jgi:micrococcal nuclease
MLYYTKITFLIFLLLVLPWTATAGPGATCRVTAVHDGDTVSVSGACLPDPGKGPERLRLIGMDAPEIGQGRWGREAKKRLKGILRASGMIAEVEFDLQKRDRYGRLLGYIRTADGALLNEMLLAEGLAVLYTIPPNLRYENRLRAAARRARLDAVGIWGPGGLRQRPSDWRREHPRDPLKR